MKSVHQLFLFALICAAFILTVLFLVIFDSENISVIIVPHHDLVAEERSDFIKHIAPRTQNRPIILLSPNHYDVGVHNIQTTNRSFTTQIRNIETNQQLYKVALQNGAEQGSVVFETEHGVKSLLLDIATYYPDQTFLPLVIKSSASHSEIKNVLSSLKEECPNCLLIASADFSHYQPYLLSEIHDKLTLRALQKLDGEIIETKAETEPMHVVWAAIQWAESSNTRKFVQWNHTNATLLTGNYYSEGTTHFFGYYQSGEEMIPDTSVSFTLSGNIISPNLENANTDVISLLGDRVLWGTDVVAGVVKSASKSTNRQLVNLIEKLNYTHVITDEQEIERQIKEKANAEVVSIHQQANITGEQSSIILRKVDWNMIATGNLPPKMDSKNVIDIVDWSNFHNYDEQVALSYCEKLIDNGSAVVVGTGLDNMSKAYFYREKLIIPSLGTFIGGSNNESLVVVGLFTTDHIEIHPLLIGYDNKKPFLERSKEKDIVLKNIFSPIEDKIIDNRGGLLYSLPL